MLAAGCRHSEAGLSRSRTYRPLHEMPPGTSALITQSHAAGAPGILIQMVTWPLCHDPWTRTHTCAWRGRTVCSGKPGPACTRTASRPRSLISRIVSKFDYRSYGKRCIQCPCRSDDQPEADTGVDSGVDSVPVRTFNTTSRARPARRVSWPPRMPTAPHDEEHCPERRASTIHSRLGALRTLARSRSPGLPLLGPARATAAPELASDPS